MESSAGPISAGLLAEWIWEAPERPGGRENLLPTELAAFLMRRIAPLIQAARVDAAAEMRERCMADDRKRCIACAKGEKFLISPKSGIVGTAAVHTPSGMVCPAQSLALVPLPPAEESFLREKIERAIERGIEYESERNEWVPNPADWRGPVRPTYESIMKEASKP